MVIINLNLLNICIRVCGINSWNSDRKLLICGWMVRVIRSFVISCIYLVWIKFYRAYNKYIIVSIT